MIFTLEADTELFDSQAPDSAEDSFEDDLSVEINESETGSSETEQGSSERDAVTELESHTEVSYPDYSEKLDMIEADARVILYVLLLFVVILFLWLTYKLYNNLLR